jgi:hypothetical protein
MQDRLGDAAGGLVGGGKVAVKVGFVGDLGDGLADQVDGGVELTGPVGHDAEQVEGIGLARMPAQHIAVQGLGFR